MSESDDQLAKVIWDYHLVHHAVEPADCILVLGSHDIRVADRGVDVFEQHLASLIIFSGGLGKLTVDVFQKPEADVFAARALERGVPRAQIIIENTSSNTGENISFTKRMLEERKVYPASFIVVQKPYMERRTYATFKKVWPEPRIMVTSPQLSFDEYMNGQYPKDYVINVMVGDLQRLRLYSERGFQIPQEVPADVWAANEELIRRGYTQHLVTS